jgi:hypothetical protein
LRRRLAGGGIGGRITPVGTIDLATHASNCFVEHLVRDFGAGQQTIFLDQLQAASSRRRRLQSIRQAAQDGDGSSGGAKV